MEFGNASKVYKKSGEAHQPLLFPRPTTVYWRGKAIDQIVLFLP
jgi:hypothetical protein